MTEKLKELRSRYEKLNELIMDPDLPKDKKRYRETMQEHAILTETMVVYDQLESTTSAIADAKGMIGAGQDPEMKEMVQEELQTLEAKYDELTAKLRQLLVPKNPLDRKNSIMEIRAGTGGDEAALFAADLYRMYQRLAEHRGWKMEVLSSSSTEIGGFKEIIFSVSGKQVFADLKFESGVHRVQRVPETESGGRIHTSAVTVAVLPEAEDTDVVINNEELRIDVFRSSGPGGQSVNTTDSAVRITHIPTGLVVTCQDEKSQHKNKAKALRVLKARLYEQEEQRRQAERASERRSQIGTGDRSERIRTYNFPQNRVTDHRIGLTLHRLDGILQGDLDEVIENLQISDREEYLKANAST